MEANRLVVANSGWAESAPEWLIEEIKTERIISGLIDVMDKGEEEVGDAETCLYLFTAGLVAPLDRDLGEAYIYLASKLMKGRGSELPPEFEKKLNEGLTEQEAYELKELKRTLWRTRGGKIKSPLFDMLKQLKKGKLK
jgi:hypothetical protein